jgi:hypothetical protein
MPNLLSIESNFLRLPEVATALRLVEVRSIQRTITNAKKKKFEQSLALAQHVKSAFEWFKSTEGQNRFREEGITWTAEDFGQKVFGWQKSFFYKMVKVASVPAEVVESYSATADQNGEESQRSVEELLKHASAVESGASPVESTPRPAVVLSLTFNHPDGKVTLKINDAGEIKVTGERAHLVEAIQFIQSSLNQ